MLSLSTLKREGKSLVNYYFIGWDGLEEKSGSPDFRVDYYPFGGITQQYNRITATKNRFLYNEGTERIDDLGLDLDMTDLRLYDPWRPGFLQIDPLADQAGQESWTPYHYGFNNPIRYNDPRGDCPTCDPYFSAGFLKGAFNAVKSTVTGTLNLLSLANNPAAQVNAAVSTVNTVQAIAGNPGAVVDAVVDGVTETANTLVNGTSFQQGEILGAGAVAVAGSILGDKGVSKLKTVAKVADKVEDLGSRAKEIHSALDPIGQTKRTTAVTEAVGKNGKKFKVVGSSTESLTPAQRAALKPGEIPARGAGHAEVTTLNTAKNLGLKPVRTGASRPICNNCEDAIRRAGSSPASPLKNQ